MACATCENNVGWLRVYNPETVKLLKGVPGSRGSQFLGENVETGHNAGGSEQFWYSSRNGNYLQFNSMEAFLDQNTKKWEFNTVQDSRYSFIGDSDADYAEFGCFKEWCIYKAKNSPEIGTFQSCNFNERLVTDFTLGSRSCMPCEESTPFSYGYADETCRSCDSLTNIIQQSPLIDQYMYNAACSETE